MDFWTDILSFVQNVTQRVGHQLLQEFGDVAAVAKADGSLVTRCDQWADGELRGAIAKTFSDHGVLTEETEHVFPDTDWCWVIDPIDGTTNFTRGIPLWGISLGLLYRGTPVFGYVALPPIQQVFHGYWTGTSGLEMPSGAFLNGAPIQVRGDDPSPTQFFSLCSRSTAVLQSSEPFPCKVRSMGAATYNLLMVAAGVGLGGVEATPKIWDIAASWVIVRAAGGVWVPLDDSEIFPLQPGQDYGDRCLPTLVASREDLVPLFRPRVQKVIEK